jgi:two-component system LytT family response regulator
MYNPPQRSYRAIIADDEPLARQRLKILLATQTIAVEVVGEASDGDMCLEMIQQSTPDLVFLDIQMPGRTGIELLQELQNPPWVIFVTAYEEFALQAFALSGIDYLVKPVSHERLQKSLEKLSRITFPNHHTDELRNALRMVLSASEQHKPVALPVKSGNRTYFIKITDIAFLKAEDKYVTLHTKEGKTHLLEQSLNYFEVKIGNPFVRVKRDYLVNSDYIEEITRYFSGSYILKIRDLDHTLIITGRSFAGVVRQLTEF